MVRDRIKRKPFNESFQESILGLLCFNENEGALATTKVQTNHFSGAHAIIAAEVLRYRKRYGKKPDEQTLNNILETMPANEAERAEAYDIVNRTTKYRKTVNPEYVLSLIDLNLRQMSVLELTNNLVNEAKTLMDNPTQESIEKAEALIVNATKRKDFDDDEGITFNDIETILGIFQEQDGSGYKIGIEPFDGMGFLLKRKTLTLYCAPKNRGKSWGCVHVGRQCLDQRARVLHITLEMSAKEVAKRYVQNVMKAARGKIEYTGVKPIPDSEGRMSDWEELEPREAAKYFGKTGFKKDLKERWAKRKNRYGRLKIKEFPTGQLSVDTLVNYLNYLEQQKKWKPDVVIVDYPDLMRTSATNLRIDTGRNIVGLRGVAVERDLVMFCPSQVQRGAFDTETVRGRNVAEDISKVNTADFVFTYSQTDEEREHHLARLCLEYARDLEAGRSTVIVQNYALGQYAVKSIVPSSAYFDRIRGRRRNQDEDADDSR